MSDEEKSSLRILGTIVFVIALIISFPWPILLPLIIFFVFIFMFFSAYVLWMPLIFIGFMFYIIRKRCGGFWKSLRKMLLAVGAGITIQFGFVIYLFCRGGFDYRRDNLTALYWAEFISSLRSKLELFLGFGQNRWWIGWIIMLIIIIVMMIYTEITRDKRALTIFGFSREFASMSSVCLTTIMSFSVMADVQAGTWDPKQYTVRSQFAYFLSEKEKKLLVDKIIDAKNDGTLDAIAQEVNKISSSNTNYGVKIQTTRNYSLRAFEKDEREEIQKEIARRLGKKIAEDIDSDAKIESPYPSNIDDSPWASVETLEETQRVAFEVDTFTEATAKALSEGLKVPLVEGFFKTVIEEACQALAETVFEYALKNATETQIHKIDNKMEKISTSITRTMHSFQYNIAEMKESIDLLSSQSKSSVERAQEKAIIEDFRPKPTVERFMIR